MRQLSDEEARTFLDSTTFLWHQRFALSTNVYTPGANDIGWLLSQSTLPVSMIGKSVLDIGTTNGAVAFEAERRGASRIVAVDILDREHFGFGALSELLESNVEFVQASVYELADVLQETFDIVVFWGVLYHLRHPLLGLDTVRRLARGHVTLETAISDWLDGQPGPLARFHRLDDLGADNTNWWSPTLEALHEWVGSAGFRVTATVTSPAGAPGQRALLGLEVEGVQPEYLRISYERPLLLQTVDLSRPGRPPER
jgi:tRNA (mo5U34)-methyltransferase